jgi:hypothetical protein
MDTPDEPDYLTDVMTLRARAKVMLSQIAQQTKQTLIDADIDLGIFFLLPNSGEAIVTFGTPGNPPDDEWNRVGEIVGSIVAKSIRLDRVRCRPVTCATTDSIADREPSQPVQPTGQSGCCSMPMHAPALQHTGAEQ